MSDDGRTQPNEAKYGEVSVDEVEAFINQLPTEYRYLAIFVFVTGAAPQAAIDLEVGVVNSRIGQLGDLLDRRSVSRVFIHPDLELVVPVYVRGRRAALLKRNNISHNEEPRQVYLDRNARPFNLKKVDAVFTRLSKKLNLHVPVTLEAIASAVIRQCEIEMAEGLRLGPANLMLPCSWVLGTCPEDDDLP